MKMSLRSIRPVVAIVAVAMLALSIGCASTVEIDSEPQGAEVRIDGQNIGKTPTHYTDNSIVFTTKRVEIKKEGYEPIRTQITRDGPINVGAVIGGFFCAWPLFLWAFDYPKYVNYDLAQEKETVPAMGVRTDDGVKFLLAPEDDSGGLAWEEDEHYIEEALDLR